MEVFEKTLNTPLFCDAVDVQVIAGMVHLTLLVEEPQLGQAPQGTEHVAVGRVVMTPEALALAHAAVQRMLDARRNGASAPPETPDVPGQITH